jgi:hypothetical protein
MMSLTPYGMLKQALEMRFHADLAESFGNQEAAEFFGRRFNEYIDAYEERTGDTLDVERYE